MLKNCLVFWKSEPQYAYKRYAYKKNMYYMYALTGGRGHPKEYEIVLGEESFRGQKRRHALFPKAS